MKLFGHRGSPLEAPENTLASFETAIAAGADGVECDVRLTADGVLVVMHDEDVSRTTDGAGLIEEMTLAQVRELDAAESFPGWAGRRCAIPTVDEVWSVTSGRVILEIKGTSFGRVDGRRTAAALAALISSRDCSAAIVSSFDPAVLAVVRAEAPEVVTGLLATPAFDAGSVIAAAVEGGYPVCFLPDASSNGPAIGAAHEAGRSVIPWTVNDPGRMRELAAWGAEGLITDDPAGARVALGA